MKIIFSPSKEMSVSNEKNIFLKDKNINFQEPVFKEKSLFISEKLKTKTKNEIKNLMKIDGKLLEKTIENIFNFDNSTKNPAIAFYNGVAYKEIDLLSYDKEQLEYLSKNLFLLSAMYGILTPFSLIKNYRLDMTMKIFDDSLYKFWKKEVNSFLKDSLKEKNEIILNLASSEYSKMIDTKLINNFISIDFKENKNGKLKSISTFSKSARGKILDIIIKNKISYIEDIKKIKFDSYSFQNSISDEKNLIFIR